MVHSRTMKIVLYSMEPRLRASPKHGGQGFFELFVPDPPRGRPFAGRRRSSYMEVCKKNLVSYLNSSIFRGNAQLQAKCTRGFHPRRCGSPDAITPGTGATSSSLSAGAAWEDRHFPLLHSYQHPEFHIHGKGILQSRKIFFLRLA